MLEATKQVNITVFNRCKIINIYTVYMLESILKHNVILVPFMYWTMKDKNIILYIVISDFMKRRTEINDSHK